MAKKQQREFDRPAIEVAALLIGEWPTWAIQSFRDGVEKLLVLSARDRKALTRKLLDELAASDGDT